MIIRKNIVLPKNKLKNFHSALNDIKALFGNINKIKKLEGLSNYNFLIELKKAENINGKFSKFVVLKLLNLNIITQKNNEKFINEKFSNLNICPKILINNFPYYYVIEYIKSEKITKKFLNTNLDKLVNLLLKLHSKDNNLFCNDINFFKTNMSLLNNIKNNHTYIIYLTNKLQFICNKLKDYPKTLAFAHNDLNKANLILDKHKNLWCIDFEYSGFSDIFFDLSSLKSILNKNSYQDLLSIYNKTLYPEISSEVFHNKLKLYHLLLLTTSATWYLYMSYILKSSSYKKIFKQLITRLNCEFNKYLIKKLY